MPCLGHADLWRAMMSPRAGNTSRPGEPQRSQHEAHSPAAKLPAHDVGFFLLATGPQVDVSRFSAPSAPATRGAPPCEPALRGCLGLYAYGVGVFASRQSARACERPWALLAIVGTERPDGRPSSDGRQQPLEAFKEVCGHVGRVAGAAGVVTLGQVAPEGTTLPGQAARHKAMREG
jgi:hypothetical protein